MVDAMFLVLLLYLAIPTTHCQLTHRQAHFLANCSFANRPYSTASAVFQQFQFPNQTSVTLSASYAFVSSALAVSTFDIGLIYPFSSANYLVPFPIVFDCASMVRSCQLKPVAGTTVSTRDSEPIRVQLTPFNYSSTSLSFNQMGLYLRQGRYQLSNCTLNDGSDVTDPRTVFNIAIQYEKSIGSSCTSTSNSCGPSSLATCSSTTSTCTCLSSFTSPVSYANAFYCADTLNASNCAVFPTRCITWCNSTSNYLCICPSDTFKIQRDNVYFCELPVNALNCSANDSVRRCPFGQCCTGGQCVNCAVTILTTATMANSNAADDSIDQRLRVALGVIGGLLGISILALLGAFCWVRQRQKRHRVAVQPSFSPSVSSLYMSPVQKQPSSSTNTIYQLPDTGIDTDRTFSPTYRTNSFRQAVLGSSRSHPPRTIIERVSTRRDSHVENSFYQNTERFAVPNYSKLDFVVSSADSSPEVDSRYHNVYQIMMSPAPSGILTYTV